MITKTIKEKDEKMRKYYCSMIITKLINNIDDIIWQQLSSTTYKDITQILKKY